MLYHGTHASLYKSLPPHVIPILEDAILKTRVKLYEAAEKVFTTELSGYRHMPIVALEHAELSLHRYRFCRVLEVLDEVPRDAFSDSEEDRQVQQLFAIFRATIRIQTEAIYEPAMQELRNLQQAWATKHVNEYTDIEVETVRKYGLACSNLSYVSSFITEEFRLFPIPSPSDAPPVQWQGLTDLRISLVSQGRFLEAIRLSSVERASCTAIERYQVTLLLLNMAMEQRARVINTTDELPWSAAMLQLKEDLGGLFATLGAKAEAEVWLSGLERDLEDIITKINGKNESFRVSDSLESMSIEYFRLKMIEKEEPTKIKFQQVLELGERMAAVSHIKADDCNDIAIIWAKKLYSGDECNAICTDIQFCTQHLLENVQGRITAAVTNLMDIVRPRATNINEAAKNIETIEAFIRRHPSVGLPTALPGVRKQLGILEVLYSHIRVHPRLMFDTESREARELQSALPTDLNFRRAKRTLEVDEDTLKVKHILDQQTTSDAEFDMIYEFFQETSQVRAPKLLQKLLIEESASGILSNNSMVQVFGVEERCMSKVRDYLLGLNESGLLERLVGNLEYPIRQAEWTKRKPFLKAWLLDASRPRLPIRHCLWIDLHNIRSAVWSSRYIQGWIYRDFVSKHHINPENIKSMWKKWALVLADETMENIFAIKDRIGLEEAKLGYSNNHYEKETFITEGSIPQLYLQIFFCSHIHDVEPNELCASSLEYAEEVARRQLTHWRGVKNYQMIAQSAIMIATIAQYRIETKIISDIQTIDRALEEALELLEEIESLFGTTLYEADLGHTFKTLETKIHMGNKMRIWNVGQIAIRLLLHAIQMINFNARDGDDEALKANHEGDVLKLWQWVQRVKARALAQSMGLDKMVPDVILAGIQDSINEERVDAKSALATSLNQLGRDNEVELADTLGSIRLEETFSPPLNLLPEVRRILKEAEITISEGSNTYREAHSSETSSSDMLDGILSMIRDLNSAKTAAEKLQEIGDIENEGNEMLRKELSDVNTKIAKKPALTKLVTIADLLNREEAIVNEINVGPTNDRFQRRIDLQRLRKEMGKEPVLQRMLRIREGWPLSSEDLHKIAAGRNGRVVFVDWFRVSSHFNQIEKIYMIIWRNGVCKLIDLETDFKKPWQQIVAFFDWKNKDVYLPDMNRTRLEEMDWERFIPLNVDVDEDDVRPVENCIELIRPLFDDPLIEADDLLVLSVTEGFHNFPLHAIEDDEKGPLIFHHPVVYIPSLSVLHKCFWARYASRESPAALKAKLSSLVLGGVDSKEEAYYYGGQAVNRIGTILKSAGTTFVGPAATYNNFTTHVSNSDLLHIHLHTNYGTREEDKPQKSPKPGLLSSSTSEDTTFTSSPLSQAIVFNDSSSQGQLSAREILALKLSRGAHVNLVGCASGKQGKFDVPNQFSHFVVNITDEVMGLVPAFLFAGAGSVTSTLWPIQDEHGAVFSCLLFKELMRAMGDEGEVKGNGKGKEIGHGVAQEKGRGGWIDLSEVHRKAVLEMRRIYKQPSAWAGFVLSGYWKFKAG